MMISRWIMKRTILKIVVVSLLAMVGYVAYLTFSPLFVKYVRNDSKYYHCVDRVNVLNGVALSYIHEPVTSDTLLVLDGDTPADAVPRLGSVIYVPCSEMAPQSVSGEVYGIRYDSLIYVSLKFAPVGLSIVDREGGLMGYIRKYQ